MAEKRAMSRIALKLTGFYALGAFGEDEAENFKRPKIKVQEEEEEIEVSEENHITKTL